ncbi:MAG: ATP-binding cassette domain-containing protein [Chloroflexi bacterium]|nr:ATP-binding cassette domain-containing protein [Chloroflexota bacterium]
MSKPILRIEDLYIEFETPNGRLKAINGISLEVLPGEIFGIVGETGCGKSITGLSVMQLLPQTARVTNGSIAFDDVDILKQSEAAMCQIRGQQVAMIFQDPNTSLNPVFTIGEQMDRVIRTQLGFSKREARGRSEEMLTAVGLPDVKRIYKSYPHQLSGGMKQRAMIAMALSCRPSLLIADEPTTALDVTIQAQILTLLKELQQQFGVTIMFITHNLGVVAQFCGRMAVLYAGRVVEMAATETIFSAPHHPYTIGLMEAVPKPGSRGAQLTAIPGNVPPNPGAIAGCAFASRCAQAMEKCTQERPPLRDAGPSHYSACFLPLPNDTKLTARPAFESGGSDDT